MKRTFQNVLNDARAKGYQSLVPPATWEALKSRFKSDTKLYERKEASALLLWLKHKHGQDLKDDITRITTQYVDTTLIDNLYRAIKKIK